MLTRAAWGFRDIAIVGAGVAAVGVFGAVMTLALGLTGASGQYLTRYAAGIATLVLPVLWVRRRYQISLWAIAAQGNPVRNAGGAAIGLFLGVSLIVLSYVMVDSIPNVPREFFSGKQFRQVMLFPFSALGLLLVFLVPVGEEVFFRAFVYGYFRKRFGIALGLVAQSALFLLAHGWSVHQGLEVLVSNLVIATVLGLLYEQTGTVHAGIACHGMVNYFTAVANYYSKFVSTTS